MVSAFPRSWSWGFRLLRLLYADLQNLFVIWVLAEDKTVHLDAGVSPSCSNRALSKVKPCLPPAHIVGSPPT